MNMKTLSKGARFVVLLGILAMPILTFGQPAQTPPTSAPVTTQPAPYTFTPLTNLPGIDDAGGSDSLPTFFNNLYRLCIGAAAVIAIIQIMQGGAYFMFNKGSVAHNQKGKSLIMNAILGLLLVLSPAIIFGIINPDILRLNLDVSGLDLGALQHLDPATSAPPSTLGETVLQALIRLQQCETRAALTACHITVDDRQVECMRSQGMTIYQRFNECVVTRRTQPGASCLVQMRTEGIQATNTCIPALAEDTPTTRTQKICLQDEILRRYQELQAWSEASQAGVPAVRTNTGCH